MQNYTYPDELEIKPLDRSVNATIRVPGSKSITNRALVLGALASRNGKVKINNILRADDTNYMIQALRQLGYSIAISEGGNDVEITSTNPVVHIPARQADLYLGNSGTCMRFLTAMVSLGHGDYRLDGDARMRERPIEDLLVALRQLGVDAVSVNNNGCPPIEIRTKGLLTDLVEIKGNVSSQFVSGLLLVAPFTSEGIRVKLTGNLVSQPFVDMTIAILREWNYVATIVESNFVFVESHTQSNVIESYEVEPDFTSASYFYAAAAISNGKVVVERCGIPSFSVQGDSDFVNILMQMGCDYEDEGEFSVMNNCALRGITVDMNAISDIVMTLAAVACFAEGPTTIRNVAHIRHKECDRITALCTELRKLGVEVEEYPDGLKITPRPMHGAVIETYNDHRMAMSMALIGLKVPGVVIKNPACVAKTYPGFWEDWKKLYD